MKKPLFLLLTAATFSTAIAADNAPIAQVGDSEITAADLRPYLENLTPAEESAVAKDPAALNQFLRTLIVQRLLLKEALAAKWDQQPDVAAALQKLRDNAIAQSYLASAAKVPADYPSEAQVQAAYDANRDALLVPKQIRLAQIFIAAPKDAAAPAKLATVTAALKAPKADFAKIATENSDEAASAAKGGDIGWLTEAQIQPGIRAAAIALKKGAVSAPIRLDDGWHILRMVDVKEAYTATLPEVKDALVRRLREQKARELSQDYVANLLEKNPVAINEIAVSKLMEKPAN
ncbi:MAG TPA: peptidylprolyl isomerase [Chthoniobacterales bacterium]|jgi:parvulin-like peptidyl-prolyl isomerase